MPRVYTVKEIFYTLQGEGAQTGTPAVFLRFAGCNLWSGREQDRADAVCQFCDTDFLGGSRYASAQELALAVRAESPNAQLVVCTGGEPLLQLNVALISALQGLGFRVAVETNGTIKAPPSLDWVCVSPKANAPFVQRNGNELKLVFPQPSLMPEALPNDLEFAHYFLQPMDGLAILENTQAAIEYCLAHPKWRLSVQTHKAIGLR